MRISSAGEMPLLCAESRLARAGISRLSRNGLGKSSVGAQQDQDAVPSVGERIAVLDVDPRHAQSPHHEPVHQLAQLLLDRVGPLGGTLDIQREDAPVERERGPPARLLAIPSAICHRLTQTSWPDACHAAGLG